MTDLKSHLTSFGNASSVVLPILLAGGWTHESVFKCPAGVDIVRCQKIRQG